LIRVLLELVEGVVVVVVVVVVVFEEAERERA
jgi:hypothetical protein